MKALGIYRSYIVNIVSRGHLRSLVYNDLYIIA